MFELDKDYKIHFIGIGGIGMSGIAKILLERGFLVSGSDIGSGNIIEELKIKGANIYNSHRSENVDDVNLVVYSSAIDDSNPEIIKAKEKRIPIIKRAEMLAEIMRLKRSITVAGSHGKTTTTSILSTILKKADVDITYIVGGIVTSLGSQASFGKSDLLVAEADESDGSFLLLNPVMSIITNVDNDHLDYYKTIDNLKHAFLEYANSVPFYGITCLNSDDKILRSFISEMKRPYLTFGRELISGQKPDYLITNIQNSLDGSSFCLEYNGESHSFTISLAGEHNVYNATGAICIMHKLGFSFEAIAEKLKEFQGVGRRLEVIYESESMLIIDDYAHHPTEISSVVKTIESVYKDYSKVYIFEPHRYSRTQQCWSEFISEFEHVESLYLLPIYPAGEKSIENINSINLAEKIGPGAKSLSCYEDFSKVVKTKIDSKTVYITMGAGAISKEMRKYANTI